MPCTVYCLPVEGSAELVSHSSPVAQRRTAPPWPTVTRPAWPPVAVRPAGAWAHRGSTRRPDPQRERGWAAEGMRRRWPPCRPLAGTRTYRNMGLLKSSKSKNVKVKPQFLKGKISAEIKCYVQFYPLTSGPFNKDLKI